MRLFLKISLLYCLAMFGVDISWAQNVRSPVISLGLTNEAPWLPNLHVPGQRVAVPAGRRIDVLILGDGYTNRARFDSDVRRWYDHFASITPWRQTTGLFRVRGYWTPSDAPATVDKRSYYRLPSSRSEVGNVYAAETRRKIWDVIEGTQANPALNREQYLSHTVVVMLIRTTKNLKPSGKCRVIVSPDGKRKARVAFGNYTHHEFGHALGRLDDEYIGGNKTSRKKQPKQISLFGVSNLAHSRDPARLQWAHLLPGTPLNPDKSSVIGLLWIGGEAEFNAWHSEPFCMMNGGSSNWNRDKTTRTGWWRSTERFCFWCEEILVARLWQRAGLLGDGSDGYALWKLWEREWRPAYHRTFDVPARLVKRNALYARSRLPDATKLYETPMRSSEPEAEEMQASDSEETSDPLEDTPAPGVDEP